MIRNWKICMAERWFGSTAIVASPNAPPSRQQARAGASRPASCPAEIRTPNATANPMMQAPWQSATRVSPATFPATRVSRETGVTKSSREKVVLPVLDDRDHPRGHGLEQAGREHAGERHPHRIHPRDPSPPRLQDRAQAADEQD